MKESTYQTPCGTIHYWSSILRLDTTTLVFLPGLTADHRLFDKQVEHFVKKYNIIVWDAQFNYADYENPSIESRAVYEVCRRHQKPVIVMEPVKGGGLIQLPEEAKAVLDGVGTGSYASYAVRYAASFEGVFMVLSGMSNYEQLADNVSYMKDFQPFTSAEYKAVERVRGDFETAGQHSLYGLPLLMCRAARSIFPSPACSAVTTPKTVWRLEQRRLLRKPDAERGKSIGVHRLRPVRAGVPAASAGDPPFKGNRGAV